MMLQCICSAHFTVTKGKVGAHFNTLFLEGKDSGTVAVTLITLHACTHTYVHVYTYHMYK